MISRYDIQQKTSEWLELRYGKIGGSNASGLFVKSDNLLDELLAAKCEDFDLWGTDDYVSKDMERGNELEPLARERLSEYTGISFKECGWLQCEENELVGISPDGISEDETICCEIKCTAAKAHLQTIKENDIPLDNIKQCLHYFTVNPKLVKLYFCSFRPENKYKALFVKELTRDSLINMGTRAKPVSLTVRESVVLAKKYANELKKEVETILKTLSF